MQGAPREQTQPHWWGSSVRPVGQAILLESGEAPQARGGFLVHVNVTRSQSGEGKRRTCGRGHSLTTWFSGHLGGVFTVCVWGC